MLPKIAALMFIAGLCLLFAAPAGSASANRPADVVIRVTSATPGQEVKVEGAYVYAPRGSDFHHVTRQTPFEIKERAGVLVGIFSATDPGGRIHVEMVSQGDQSGHTVATATAMAVTVTTDEHQGGSVIRGL